MSSIAMRTDSWAMSEEADRRFRKIFLEVLIPMLILAAIVPWLKLVITSEEEPLPEFVEVIQEQPAPPPPPEQAKAEEPKPSAEAPREAAQPKPAPVEHNAPAKSARQVAEQSGLMQFRDQLADMRDHSLAEITGPETLSTPVLTSAGGTTREMVASSAATGSGGVAGGGSLTGSQAGTGLGTRRTGAVQSPVGNGDGAASSAGGSKGKPVAGRTREEIQLTFDRNKNAFFAIYNRAARADANLDAGRIVVSLTIAPDGSVTQCAIVTSSFGDAELEQKILQRVKLLNFGAKNVPPFTFPNYPIDFVRT